MANTKKSKDARILTTIKKLKQCIDLWHINVTTMGNQDAWSDRVLEEILMYADNLGKIYYEGN